MMWIDGLTHWHWLVLGAILLIAEVSVGGGFLLWIGISALVVSVIVWVIPNLNWGMQLLIFSIAGVLASILWWAYLKKHPIATEDPKLNLRSQQYVGQVFTLTQAIVNGRGRIRVGDTTWTVTGPDLPEGIQVKIIRAEGVVLVAEKYEKN